MTYFPKVNIGLADTASVDAFSRLRTSSPTIMFENKQLYDDQSLIWSTFSENGGTFSHNPNRASTTLTVTTTNGSKVIRQTKQRANYKPGKSLQTMQTFVMGTGSVGIIKRAGLFDENNGVFLETSGTNVNLCLRNNLSGSPAVNKVSQSAWNIDPLNGSGPSGITLNLNRIQIFFMDYEWLGAGRVRMGFSFDGEVVHAHEFIHSNISDSAYMSTPNLPIRYELINSGSTNGSLEQICTVVNSEGGESPVGQTRSITRLGIPVSVTSGTLAPIMSIRLKSTHIGSNVILNNINIMPDDNTSFFWGIYLNPVVSGSDNASWQNVTGSAIQYDISRNSNNSISSGTLIQSGYVAAGTNNTITGLNSSFSTGLVLSADVNDVVDQLVVAVRHLGVGTVNFYSSMTWFDHQ